MIVFLSARLLPLYRSLTAASNSSLVAMLTRLIPPSARLPSREQLRRGNRHDSGAVLARQCEEIEAASHTLGLQTQIVNVGTGDDIDAEFASLNARGAGGLLVVDDPLFNDLRTKLVTLAARHRIPAIYFQGEFVREGGLISYATSYAEQFRQIGIYTGQILKGAKPSDLPVMQPTKF